MSEEYPRKLSTYVVSDTKAELFDGRGMEVQVDLCSDGSVVISVVAGSGEIRLESITPHATLFGYVSTFTHKER